MPEGKASGGVSAASVRTLEICVAALILVLGAAVTFDSWQLGARWAEDGPQAGYFPFYIGLLLLFSALTIMLRALRNSMLGLRSFVSVAQLKMVLMLLVPSIVYVAFIHWIGIYLASIAFIAFFMMWLGKYRLAKAAAVSVGVMVAFFLVFEVWFKVPLPKGPVEALLGLH